MARLNELVFDAWSGLEFKRSFGARSASAGIGWEPPNWVGYHSRRLQAYTILRAYADNIAREFMTTTDRDEIEKRREYGDANLLVNSILAALLGDEQTIAVDGAEDFDETSSNDASTTAAHDLQDWLQAWADAERLGLKMLETERKAVMLGDGVYSLGWSSEKGRPRLRVWDPGFYFPVLDDGNDDDYPSKVHIAWEVEDDELNAKGKLKIRRITWELAALETPVKRAWNDEPSTVTCLLSDGTWIADVGKQNVEDLTEAAAVWAQDSEGEVFMRDLQIDFLPVIHVPNTVALLEHYGKSVLASVLQVLDDLAAADTDLASASATTGSPIIALSKATLGGAAMQYRPGQVFETGDGKMDVLDTSKALDALTGYIEFLLKRLSVNARVPESVLGRVKPSEVPSGIALALSFGPLEQLVKEMRLVRAEKYPLLLKFAQRIAIAGGVKDVPQVFDAQANVQMGSFLPQDQAEAVDLVTKLLAVKPIPSISLETAVAMLIEAGFPIRDAAVEVERIQSRDFAGAAELLSAVGEEGSVYDYLGLEQPVNPTPAPQVTPPAGAVDPNAQTTDSQPQDPNQTGQ